MHLHLLDWITDTAADSSSVSSVVETLESFRLSSEPLANFTSQPRWGPLLWTVSRSQLRPGFLVSCAPPFLLSQQSLGQAKPGMK
jgi:hypothetical protein